MKRQVYKIIGKEIGDYSEITVDDLWLQIDESSEGSVNVGAGLSIDGEGNVQLGITQDESYQRIDIDSLPGHVLSFGAVISEGDPGNYGWLLMHHDSVGESIDNQLLTKVEEFSAQFTQESRSTYSQTMMQVVSNGDATGLHISSVNPASFQDTIFNMGLSDNDDYSANKTDYSYITPAWIKYQAGYNASVPQYFTHDGSGSFEWVNI